MSVNKSSPLENRMLPLDGLRGLAATTVICYHINPDSQLLCWAWTLVDLFFVISGFLIGSIIYRGLREDRLQLKYFWIRRVLRVWPVYFMTLGTVLFLSAVWPDFAGRTLVFKEIFKSLFFIQFTGGYIHPGANWFGVLAGYVPWFGHSWSIAAEEQFYILMPLILLVIGISTRRIFIAALVAIAVAQLMLVYLNYVPGLLGTRMQGLALGLALVPLSHWLTQPQVDMPNARRNALWLLGVSFVIGALIVGPSFAQVLPAMSSGRVFDAAQGEILMRRSVLGMALVYFAFCGYLIAYPKSFAGRFLSMKIPVYLGGISYALYMFHVPIEGVFVTLLKDYLSNVSWMMLGAYWIVVIGLAHLSRIFVENRFNNMKDRFPVYRKKVSTDAQHTLAALPETR